jgi:hypothetical protein
MPIAKLRAGIEEELTQHAHFPALNPVHGIDLASSPSVTHGSN